MKKYALALFAVLGLAFICLSPTKAQAAITCTTPTVSAGAYPENYLWYCGSNSGYEYEAQTALENLGAYARTAMSSNRHYIYVFTSLSDYQSYCTTTGNITSTPPIPACGSIPSGYVADTYTPDGGTTWISVVFESAVIAKGWSIGHSTDHEAGHQLDYILGTQLYGAGQYATQQDGKKLGFAYELTGMSITVEGLARAKDVLTISFIDQSAATNGPPAPIQVTYTVKSGDTLNTIATGLAAAINAKTTLTGSPLYVSASASGVVITTLLNSTQILSYAVSLSAGATEYLALTTHDWPAFTALTPQCALNAGVFSDQKDSLGRWICSTLQTVAVGGTVTAGNVLTVTVTDPLLPGNHMVSVPYTVPSGATTSTIATGIALAISANQALLALHITDQAAGANVALSSGTEASTYEVSESTGATETLTLGTLTNGVGNTLSNSYAGNGNDVALQQAWSYYYLPTNATWTELFAEEVATVSGQFNGGSNASPDDYLQEYNSFYCSQAAVRNLLQTGSLPAFTGTCQ